MNLILLLSAITSQEGMAQMGQYDKYPIRNANGFIEYLTRGEIENLRNMGESVEELDGPASNRYPPIAKNPANQAHVNEMFYEDQRQRAEERRQRRGGRTGAGRVVGGIVSAGFAAGTLGGAATHPQQQSDTTQQHYGQSSLNEERGRRGRQARDATRDKGSRDRDSGQQ